LHVNLFEKLGKSEMKNWNLHSNLSYRIFFNYQKDKCSIQGGLYKGWYIQCLQSILLQKNYHYGFFSSNGVGI
jgi:hypothetical protein